MRTIVLAGLLLSSGPAVFARIHTPRLDAFHAELRKCIDDLSAARTAARNAPLEERKKRLRAAKIAYKQCETHANRVFKYWPLPPPEDLAPAPAARQDVYSGVFLSSFGAGKTSAHSSLR